MKYTILLDMDEVLVDFVSGACRAHGVRVGTLSLYQPPGDWSIVAPISSALGHDFCMTQDEFWEPIHTLGMEFWENLEPTPWAGELLKRVKEDENWFIVSAPSRESNSYSGKAVWLKDRLGKRFDRFFLTPHKEMLAGRDRILIDDREENLKKFKQAGGLGVLFPAYGNSLFGLRDEPLNYVFQQLVKIESGSYQGNL